MYISNDNYLLIQISTSIVENNISPVAIVHLATKRPRKAPVRWEIRWSDQRIHILRILIYHYSLII